MVKVSVAITCKEGTDLSEIHESLRKQTFKDFEIVITHDKTMTEGYNSDIEQVKGNIIVFLESDCTPLTETWLEELISEVEDGIIVKGLEVRITPLSVANTAITRKTIENERFNEDFYPAIDTDFLRRLMLKGAKVKEVNKAIVYHKKVSWKTKSIKRRLLFSFLFPAKAVRSYYRYGPKQDLESDILKRKDSRFLGKIIRTFGNHLILIVEGIIGIIGTIYGAIRYLPEIRYRKMYRKKE